LSKVYQYMKGLISMNLSAYEKYLEICFHQDEEPIPYPEWLQMRAENIESM
jgi:hypothetical protein